MSAYADQNHAPSLTYVRLELVIIADYEKLSYMEQAFRWTTEEKRYILELMEIQKTDFLPEDIKKLLNVYREKHSLEEQ